ncbi:hypothetical protein O4220_20785 [Rhodococcus ruber]|uniref:Uncharacterized protein n=1 Tax=Rhodococcus ruber TaxID=1830 RepID=A0ABT4MLM4_9NOCA|nr:hypothetical protein [Rhodococcus ruber]MCZ4520955.1 hypothetical protein [Rhodococcus ruber]
MSSLQLTDDEYSLYLAIPEDGSSIGNKAARTKLGNWAKPRYWAAREGLVSKQLVLIGGGGGGSVRRIVSDDEVSLVGEPARQTTDLHAIVVRPRSREKSLYGPLVTTLADSWSAQRRSVALAVEDTSSQGSKKTGGTWTRPDIVAVNLKKYDYLPGSFLEVTTFEVKPADYIGITAVYEALAHRRAATHSYVLLQVPAMRSNSLSAAVEDVRVVATEHGIGVITFADEADFDTWDVLDEAVRNDPDPEKLNDFIATQLSFDAKINISEFVR